MWEVLYSLLIYTSDDPGKFQYFNDAFTNRLNQTSKIQFIDDKSIENNFFLNIIKNKNTPEFEKKIISTTECLKNNILSQKFDEAKKISEEELNNFEKNLLKYPYTISQTALIHFYFWNIIANLDDKEIAEPLLSSFLNSATLADRNVLESGLTHNLYKKFSKLLTFQKSYSYIKYSIENNEKCSIILNGRPLSQNVFMLSHIESVTLNAICPNGFYSQRITPTSNTTIKILPKIKYSIPSMASMPPINLFPVHLLEKKKIKSLIFIHWSSKKNYIQTTVANPSNFGEKRELILQLTSKEDLNSAGDKIMKFIFTYFKYLIE